jgi:hypothetical protein
MKRWFGGNDAFTSPSYFACDEHTLDHERFPELVAKLQGLADHRYHVGEYASPWVELIYLDDESPRKVVAYRHTSDISYRIWHPQLMEIAGSFARGGWYPFRDEHQHAEFFGPKQQPEEEGGESR